MVVGISETCSEIQSYCNYYIESLLWVSFCLVVVVLSLYNVLVGSKYWEISIWILLVLSAGEFVLNTFVSVPGDLLGYLDFKKNLLISLLDFNDVVVSLLFLSTQYLNPILLLILMLLTLNSIFTKKNSQGH
jgi:hypothetical protein